MSGKSATVGFQLFQNRSNHNWCRYMIDPTGSISPLSNKTPQETKIFLRGQDRSSESGKVLVNPVELQRRSNPT